MLLSELANKKIVNLRDGEIIGEVGNVDLIIDELTGDVVSLLVPVKQSLFGKKNEQPFITIDWSSIKKIGSEIMVVEIDSSFGKFW